MSSEVATLESMGRELGERITETAEYRAFEAAREAVENDPEAQDRIETFEQVREEFMVARKMGSADEASVRRLKQAQEELHSLPVMEEYISAQEQLTERLASINDAISEPLAIDFGGEAGGCCQD